MSLLAKCPGCGRSYDVGERHVGKKAKCADCGASFELRPAAEQPRKSAEGKPSGSSVSRAVRRTRTGSGSSEIRLPPTRGASGPTAAPPVVSSASSSAAAPSAGGSVPPVRAVQPAGPVISTHEPAGAAHRVVGRRSRGGGGLIATGVVVVGVAATIGILFALGVFDGEGESESPAVVANGNGENGDGDSAANGSGDTNSSTDGQTQPHKSGDPADPIVPADSSSTDPGNPTAPSGEPANGSGTAGVEPIEPIPAPGTPPNSGMQGDFTFRVRGNPIALYEIDAVIEPKEPRLDIIEPEEITGPKLADGDEFEITCIQKQAFLGFVKGADGQKKSGKISRDDIQFDDESTYLVEDEDSVLYLQNRVVELTRGPSHGVEELSVVANSLLENPHMKHVANLPYLKKATFLDAKIGDAGIVHLAGLTNLESLSFSGTSGIGDEALAHLKHLTKLKELHLDGTKVSDAGLGHLAAMPWLDRVVLTNTQVTEEGAKRLKAALKKTEVVR